ncbi:hypothetical protein GCM10009682_47500 [Luedemannella flava]|uniref:Type II secretion system protein n=1 Tax=Luedemannella flava TaxID=349316 RepID=A0ABP4YPH1_9ACTN
MPGHRTRSDDGLSLIETLVSAVIITIVMGATTTFFINTMKVSHSQGVKQVAIQLAGEAVDRARAMPGATVVVGRDRTTTDQQWAGAPAGVTAYLADMVRASDPAAINPSGQTAALPTVTRPVVVNGITYGQNWYVGNCWQPVSGGACGPTQVAGYAVFYRVVVVVTWADNRCVASSCSYVTTTLINSAITDPVFR